MQAPISVPRNLDISKQKNTYMLAWTYEDYVRRKKVLYIFILYNLESLDKQTSLTTKVQTKKKQKQRDLVFIL